MASIWIDKKYSELMSEIAPREGSEDEQTFTSMAHASCFAAALAYNQGKAFDKKLKINRGDKTASKNLIFSVDPITLKKLVI